MYSMNLLARINVEMQPIQCLRKDGKGLHISQRIACAERKWLIVVQIQCSPDRLKGIKAVFVSGRYPQAGKARGLGSPAGWHNGKEHIAKAAVRRKGRHHHGMQTGCGRRMLRGGRDRGGESHHWLLVPAGLADGWRGLAQIGRAHV